MAVFGLVVAVLLALWTALLFVPLSWRPVGMFLFVPKMAAGALSPVIAVTATLLAVLGAVAGAWWIVVVAGSTAVGAAVVVLRVGAVRPDLAAVLGPGERAGVPDGASHPRPVARWWRGRLPRVPAPVLRRDVVCWTEPDTGVELRCDVWGPAAGVGRSGVAVVYLHGSAWYILDKDVGTRGLFGQLTAHGHVVVDVAYRLFPDTDIPGMVWDVKRAVAWVRAHADELQVRPDRIVLCGGSAGGHLALLAAYTRDDPHLTPPELRGQDPPVRAVVSLYGQADLAAMYDHTGQRSSCSPDDPMPDWDAPAPPWTVRLFGEDAHRLRLHRMTVAGRCDWLVGGTPDAMPQRYAQLSPVERVRVDCPPTVLIHGLHDEMAPVSAIRRLHRRLTEAGVPTTAVLLPHTDHAFDLLLTTWSPPARAEIHTLQRVLSGVAAPAAVA